MSEKLMSKSLHLERIAGSRRRVDREGVGARLVPRWEAAGGWAVAVHFGYDVIIIIIIISGRQGQI